MLKLRYLNGSLAGKYIDLKPGDNIVGRLANCDVVLNTPGVSKRHAKLTIQGTQCVVTDLGSSNGTFVNGTKVTDRILRPGDKLAFHNTILELVSETAKLPKGTSPQAGFAPQWNSNLAYQQAMPNGLPPLPLDSHSPQMQKSEVSPMGGAAPEPDSLLGIINTYVNKVVLPGVYKLTEFYPVKNVIGLFILFFILFVTALSTIPMIEMTKSGVQKESQRRALTLTKQLAAISEKAIASGAETSIRTDDIEAEDGVSVAVVVAKEDGHIIAPLTKSQNYSNDEFVARGRKHDETYVQQIDDTTIGVSVPIRSFSSEAGQQVIIAFAQIVYKMDTFQWNESIGLFARVLVIALLLGGLLYYLINRVVAHPIEEVIHQVDQALRGERETLTSKYDFKTLGRLTENINSLIGRMSQGANQNQVEVDRSNEASNLVRIISDAAFALDSSGNILQVNATFEELTGMRLLTLQGQSLEILQDQALKLNIEDLVSRAKAQPGTIITSHIDISGIGHEMDVQASPEGQGIGYIIGTLKKGGFG